MATEPLLKRLTVRQRLLFGAMAGILVPLLTATRRRWSLDALAPWGARPSLYEHLRTHYVPGQRLPDAARELPDERGMRAENGAELGVHWSPGAQDGAGRRGGVGPSPESAARADHVVDLMRQLMISATPKHAQALYQALAHDYAIEIIDPLLERLLKDRLQRSRRLEEIGRWLATRAPDREPVKVGIALLGITTTGETRETLMLLGRHDEFTLYATVALSHSEPNPEPWIWDLAQSLEGWGRIEAVERLAETQDPAIRQWLLRAGYRNTIMPEYTAYVCATAGALHDALEQPTLDPALRAGAGEILRTLAELGDGEGDWKGLTAYPQGAHAITAYLQQVAPTASSLKELLTLGTIRRYLDDPQADWTRRAEQGWTAERRAALQQACAQALAAPA
jgi:hypothetical protein